MKRKSILFLIIASVMILSGCSKSESSSPNPVSGSRYRWDTDYPDILRIKTSSYYLVFDFVSDSECETYYTDRNGNITEVIDSYGYIVSGDSITILKDGSEYGFFAIRTSKCIILMRINGHDVTNEYFKY